jgi:hypothetical protein
MEEVGSMTGYVTSYRQDETPIYSETTPEEEAQDALDRGIPRGKLSMAAQIVYDQLKARKETSSPGGAIGRTPPEIRERILTMFKEANGKYAKPFAKDRLAWMSVFVGNWEEYGSIVLQMAMLDTLFSIEEKLDQLVRLARAEPPNTGSAD